jgi:hypothetical protein
MTDAPDITALQKIAAAQTASVPVYNTELVRSAWSAVQRLRRAARNTARQAAATLDYAEDAPIEDPLCYAYIEELWTDHVIVRLDNNSYLRIPYTVEAPGTTADNVKFGTPEAVRQAYVAASASRKDALSALLALSQESDGEAALSFVRTMEGARRYRKPIGAQFGQNGGPAAAPGTPAAAPSAVDRLRSAASGQGKPQGKPESGAVFGQIANAGKLKGALSQVGNLPDNKQGAAAAEIVKAAQALGLTSLVPESVKRLYRQFIAQGPIHQPSKAPVKKKG